MNETGSIPLYLSNGKAYCWEAEDAAILRVQHRICGLTTGTLPGVSQQNAFLGLPIVLMPEEVVLLVENGTCHLIYTPNAFRTPSSSHMQSAALDRVHGAQIAKAASHKALVDKKEARRAAMGAQDEAKRKQKQKQQTVEAEEEDDRPPADLPIASANATEQNLAREISSIPHFVAIEALPHSTGVTQPWYHPHSTATVFHNLADAREHNAWLYPQTPLERARCSTFRALWEQGMFLGQGVKFGGEFLVYPGDPLRYHSHFVTTTIGHPDVPIQPMELVAFGRLGTATKKAHLLCCYDNKKDERGNAGGTEFYSLEWGNFG